MKEVKGGDQDSISELTGRQVLLLDTVDRLSKSSAKISENRKLLAPNSNDSLRVSLALSSDEELSDQISVLESVRKFIKAHFTFYLHDFTIVLCF